MPFTAVSFIFFFAIVFTAYYALPHRFRWMLLLLASWTFYGWMSPSCLAFLAFVTVVTYFSAIGIDNNYCKEQKWVAECGRSVSREEKRGYKALMERKRRLIGSMAIVGLLVLLIVFKYLQFVLSNVAWLSGSVGLYWQAPTFNLILPIGLSFYVFQSLAYVIDVQRGEIRAERMFFKHALFVSYFPQIMQGPIGNYGRLASQLFGRHDFDYERTVHAIQRAAWGFFKKLVVANVIAQRIDPTWHNAAQYPGFLTWMTVLFLYSIQLYADFSGYMDIACGCSEMLGVKLDENFNCPYFAKSVSEFWRRWHMTLSSWFKDYLFYPVLRSDWNSRWRKFFTSKYLSSVIPTSVALAIVWAATGLWHGASWGYVAWGVYYGVFMCTAIILAPLYDCVHKMWPSLKDSRVYILFQTIRTFLIVMMGYSIFKPASLHCTWEIWNQLSLLRPGGGLGQQFHQIRFFLCDKILIGVVILFLVDLIHFKCGFGVIRRKIRGLPFIVRWAVYCGGVFAVVFWGRYGAAVQQFEYFKF